MLAGCLQNTGEGGIAPHHRHGGELVWQIGTGYFGCRERDGRSSSTRSGVDRRARPSARSRSSCRRAPSRASAASCPPRRSRRRSPRSAASTGKDCVSPAAHTAFRDVDELLDFVEAIAATTGLPVGIKSAVGEQAFWHELAASMRATAAAGWTTSRSTAARAAPAPRRWCSPTTSRCRSSSASPGVRGSSPSGVAEDLVFIGSGKLGFPETGLFALRDGLRHDQRRARGDARDRLHPGAALPHRPLPDRRRDAEPWLMRGLDPTLKSARARELHRRAAQGAARARERMRARPPRARRPRHARDRRRALQRRPVTRCSATSPAGRCRRRRAARRSRR